MTRLAPAIRCGRTHFVTTSLCLRQVKAYAQQLKSWVLPEKPRMNLHEQLGALEMGVDQLIQAVVAPQAENIPETPARSTPRSEQRQRDVSVRSRLIGISNADVAV